MFRPEDILYEDNHLIAINKQCGDLVQSDPEGNTSLEEEVKEYIKVRDGKPGAVFLGVIHRIDRPVSGVVLFAKTSKALTRMNEAVRLRKIDKRYWAITEERPENEAGELRHYIARDGKSNKSHVYTKPRGDAQEAFLRYSLIGASTNYSLLEIELITGRHHQIRAQLSRIGCPIKGDLKYGASRSNKGGGISLHSRSVTFEHPTLKEQITIEAPVPQGDNLWTFFEESQSK